ncbi:hypothetical protein GQ42DRAFT_178274 [Ramicandelaber brevisporus]|nr:hypothetical protein GQ42DRAFT_178274 [Ramicandelaber brevisporus]
MSATSRAKQRQGKAAAAAARPTVPDNDISFNYQPVSIPSHFSSPGADDDTVLLPLPLQQQQRQQQQQQQQLLPLLMPSPLRITWDFNQSVTFAGIHRCLGPLFVSRCINRAASSKVTRIAGSKPPTNTESECILVGANPGLEVVNIPITISGPLDSDDWLRNALSLYVDQISVTEQDSVSIDQVPAIDDLLDCLVSIPTGNPLLVALDKLVNVPSGWVPSATIRTATCVRTPRDKQAREGCAAFIGSLGTLRTATGDKAADNSTDIVDDCDDSATLVDLDDTTGGHSKDQVAEKRELRLVSTIREMADTERSYLNSLQVMHSLYVVPLRSTARSNMSNPASASTSSSVDSKVTMYTVNHLFSNIDDIIAASEQLLYDLEKLVDMADDPDDDRALLIGTVCVKHMLHYDIYAKYIACYQRASSTLKRLLEESELVRRMVQSGRERPESHKRALDDLLMMPVQRIPQYRLLLRQLLRFIPLQKFEGSEYRLLQMALDKIDEIGLAADDHEDAVQALTLLSELLATMEDCPPTIMNATRRLTSRMEATIEQVQSVSGSGSGNGGGIRHVHVSIMVFNDRILLAEWIDQSAAASFATCLPIEAYDAPTISRSITAADSLRFGTIRSQNGQQAAASPFPSTPAAGQRSRAASAGCNVVMSPVPTLSFSPTKNQHVQRKASRGFKQSGSSKLTHRFLAWCSLSDVAIYDTTADGQNNDIFLRWNPVYPSSSEHQRKAAGPVVKMSLQHWHDKATLFEAVREVSMVSIDERVKRHGFKVYESAGDVVNSQLALTYLHQDVSFVTYSDTNSNSSDELVSSNALVAYCGPQLPIDLDLLQRAIQPHDSATPPDTLCILVGAPSTGYQATWLQRNIALDSHTKLEFASFSRYQLATHIKAFAHHSHNHSQHSTADTQVGAYNDIFRLQLDSIFAIEPPLVRAHAPAIVLTSSSSSGNLQQQNDVEVDSFTLIEREDINAPPSPSGSIKRTFLGKALSFSRPFGRKGSQKQQLQTSGHRRQFSESDAASFERSSSSSRGSAESSQSSSSVSPPPPPSSSSLSQQQQQQQHQQETKHDSSIAWHVYCQNGRLSPRRQPIAFDTLSLYVQGSCALQPDDISASSTWSSRSASWIKRNGTPPTPSALNTKNGSVKRSAGSLRQALFSGSINSIDDVGLPPVQDYSSLSITSSLKGDRRRHARDIFN